MCLLTETKSACNSDMTNIKKLMVPQTLNLYFSVLYHSECTLLHRNSHCVHLVSFNLTDRHGYKPWIVPTLGDQK